MIKMYLTSEGDTYITKGTVRLYIHHNSPRCEHSTYRELMECGVFNARHRSEFSESSRMVSMFQILKTEIYYATLQEDQPMGEQDSVNCIVFDCVSRVQELANGSVFV